MDKDTTLAQLKAELELAKRQISNLERANSRLGLNWEDQREAIEDELETALPVLREVTQLAVNPASEDPHILIEGDNLHALTALQATHRRGVDVIYIDPPYNTGKEFVYNDRIVGDDDTWRHSKWLSFMSRRLRLAQRLLTENGVIFISIDDNEQAHLKLLCDTVFGESNFIGMFTWVKKRKASNLSGSVRNITEYVLSYGNGGGVSIVHPNDTVEAEKPYPFYNTGNTRNTLLFPAGIAFTALPDGTYTPKDYPAKKTLVALEDTVVISGGVSQNAFRVRGEWRYAQSTLDALVRSGEEIQFKGLDFKPYWINRNTDRVKRMLTLLSEETYGIGTNEDGNEELFQLLGKGQFDYPKPVSLITALLAATVSDRPRAVVLDFFAGSGTTGHAVSTLNERDGGARQAILITNNENGICERVTRPRLKAVLTGQWADGSHTALPGGLRYFRCGTVSGVGSTDAVVKRLSKECSDLIAIKENCFSTTDSTGAHKVLSGQKKTVVLWFDEDTEELGELLEQQDPAHDRVVYVFGYGDTPDPDIAENNEGWVVKALPKPILAELKKAYARRRKM